MSPSLWARGAVALATGVLSCGRDGSRPVPKGPPSVAAVAPALERVWRAVPPDPPSTTSTPDAGTAASLDATWLMRTQRDAALAAVTSGVRVEGGDAIVASHGLLARIAPDTGRVRDVADLSGDHPGHCNTARAALLVYVACAVSDDYAKGGSPNFVYSLPPPRSLRLRTPEATHLSATNLRTTERGGVMIPSACRVGKSTAACVRQPNGTWRALVPERGATGDTYAERGGAPRFDGSLVYVGFDVDDEPEIWPTDEGRQGAFRPRFVTLSATGKSRLHAVWEIPDRSGDLRVVGSVEEDHAGTLYAVLSDDHGLIFVEETANGVCTVRRDPLAKLLRQSGRWTLVVRGGDAYLSSDFGRTFTPLALPENLRVRLSELPRFDDTEEITLSSVGMRVFDRYSVHPYRPDAPEATR